MAAPPRQAVLGLNPIPLAADVQQFLDSTKTAAPSARSRPMTSKQAKKAYLDRTRGPKLSKEERRRLELAELARIKREEQEFKKQREKERAANKARILRDKKKEKEEQEKLEKRKQGLPLVNVHPSQDTITRFFRGNGTCKKREPDGSVILPTSAGDSAERGMEEMEEMEEMREMAEEEADDGQDEQSPEGEKPEEEKPEEETEINDFEDQDTDLLKGPSQSISRTEFPKQLTIDHESLVAGGDVQGNIDEAEADPDDGEDFREDSCLAQSIDGIEVSPVDPILHAGSDQHEPRAPSPIQATSCQDPFVGEVDSIRERRLSDGDLTPVSLRSSAREQPKSPPTEATSFEAGRFSDLVPPAADSHRNKTSFLVQEDADVRAPHTPMASTAADVAPISASASHPPLILPPAQQDFMAHDRPMPRPTLAPDIPLSCSLVPPRASINPRWNSQSLQHAKLSPPKRGQTSSAPVIRSILKPPTSTSAVLAENRFGQNKTNKASAAKPLKVTFRPSPQTPPQKPIPRRTEGLETSSAPHVPEEEEDEDLPPTSTQLFIMSNLDDLFPSPSQEARELSLSKPAPPRPSLTAVATTVFLPFVSTQDLVISTQDLQDMDMDMDDSLSSVEPDDIDDDRRIDDAICRDLELFGSQLVRDDSSSDDGGGRLGIPIGQQKSDVPMDNVGAGDFEKMTSSFEQAMELMAQHIEDDELD